MVETKVVSSTVVSLGASIAVAVLNGVAANSALLGGLPPVLQALILIIIPPVLTFLGGYVKKSPTSTVSSGYNG